MDAQPTSFAERQKALSADQIEGVARAVHTAAREIEAQMPLVARSAHNVADRLGEAAARVHTTAPAEIATGLDRWARDEPLIFFGAAVLAGFAASRLLRKGVERA